MLHLEALRAGLRELGCVEGIDILIEFRRADRKCIGSPT
jgi:hypothetical protein